MPFGVCLKIYLSVTTSVSSMLIGFTGGLAGDVYLVGGNLI